MTGRVNVAAGFATRSTQRHDLRQPVANDEARARYQRDRDRRAQSELTYLGRIASPRQIDMEMVWTATPTVPATVVPSVPAAIEPAPVRASKAERIEYFNKHGHKMPNQPAVPLEVPNMAKRARKAAIADATAIRDAALKTTTDKAARLAIDRVWQDACAAAKATYLTTQAQALATVEAAPAMPVTATVPTPSTPLLRPARRRCSEPHPDFPGMTKGAVLDRQMARAAVYAAATEGRASMTA